MSIRFRRIVFLIGGLALLSSLAFSWNAKRGLQAARCELLAVRAANESLKSTLGEMIKAIAAKDREIDRLQYSDCGGQGKPAAPSQAKPDRNKVPGTGALRTENAQ